MGYIWRLKGLYKADANEVGKEISSLGDMITPSNVVSLAKNEKSCMHDLFEWNDTIAGQKYREQQAQGIIQQLVFEKPTENKSDKIVRVFYSSGNRDNTYKKAEVVFQDATEYDKLLEQAKAELQNFKRKYSCLKELDYILNLIH